MKKKITVLLADRANYGRLKPVMRELQKSDRVELSVLAAGTMLLERYGQPVDIVEADGFSVNGRAYIEIEGSTPLTMTKSLGFSIGEFANELTRLKPDILLVIGDHYEALGAVLAAGYLNVCVAHVQGGEVSGSIDECARHAITKFAQYHFTATARAREFVIKMGESPERVFHTGCPVADVISEMDQNLKGHEDVWSEPYLLAMFHPTTTDYDETRNDFDEMFFALNELKHKTVWLWPNMDAGGNLISQKLKQRLPECQSWLKVVKNFCPEDFQRVLANARCAVGNSSSFVRDSTFFGTPVTLVGQRQVGRELSDNIHVVSVERGAIVESVQGQINHGHYPVSQLYGRKGASQQIANLLEQLEPAHKKQLQYLS